MPIPESRERGTLPPGLHAASLREAVARFGSATEQRRRLAGLLAEVVAAARPYPTIKRVLVWGSLVTDAEAPRDLDYSIVVAVTHIQAEVAKQHRRFLAPLDARRYYGVDRRYMLVPDFPLDEYADLVHFLLHDRAGRARGILEISLRGEIGENAP